MDFAETREAEKLLRERDAEIEGLKAKLAERVDLHDVDGRALVSARAEVERLRTWIDDLQSGMFINCVYCGHRYGPRDEVPDSMADVLRRHVEQCPQHPMSELRKKLAWSQEAVASLLKENEGLLDNQCIVDGALVPDPKEEHGCRMCAIEEGGKSLRAALVRVHAVGYNQDCLFCGFKDKIVTEALHGPQAPPVNEEG